MLNTLVVTKKMRDQLNPANQREAMTFGRESVGLAADSYFLLTPLLFKREWKDGWPGAKSKVQENIQTQRR